MGWCAMTRLPMTAAGHAALEDELRGRIRIERPRLVQRIQQAIADDANLMENSEYQAAQAEQNVNEARDCGVGRQACVCGNRRRIQAFRQYDQIWCHRDADRR